LNTSQEFLRRKVAKEAANLLYFQVEKEYKQAKLKAANILGSHFLPTNLEVAIELDKIAEENEGLSRKTRLIQMRREALRIMKLLKAFHPILVGSVWRGTIRHGSDIDIAVYNDEPDSIIKILRQNTIKILQAEWVTLSKRGKTQSSFHVYLQLPNNEKAEIVVRSQEERSRKEKCETFGDEISGLDLNELEKLLKENPTRQFIPS
jgi:predicted nucleotidyltransferase